MVIGLELQGATIQVQDIEERYKTKSSAQTREKHDALSSMVCQSKAIYMEMVIRSCLLSFDVDLVSTTDVKVQL